MDRKNVSDVGAVGAGTQDRAQAPAPGRLSAFNKERARVCAKVLDKIWIRLAWRLPRRQEFWAFVRVVANSTGGVFDSEVVSKLTAVAAAKRWQS